MDTKKILESKNPGLAGIALVAFLAVLATSSFIASMTQKGFGRTEVSNVRYENYNGINIRAKLFKPVRASKDHPVPGVIYIHGYQNNRETGDAYCLEIARRGIAVLNIDAIGRGNSGIPNDPESPDFDITYGGKTSLQFLRSLPFIKKESIGLMGHSLGAEMAYTIALNDHDANALVISGFAYTKFATASLPKNMLMIFGKWDEYRGRMTGTRDFEKEWMSSPQTRNAIPGNNLKLGVTYGDFKDGTARRVFMPLTTHVQESHSSAAIAEAVSWMRKALNPDEDLWIDENEQIWQIKEWATLLSMLAGLFSLIPLGLILLRTKFFRDMRGPVSGKYSRTGKTYLKSAVLNAILMWLYLPLIFVLFGIHVYVIHIDGAFPLMMANGVLWWFFWTNVIGFLIIRRWYKKKSEEVGLDLYEMGVSFEKDKFTVWGSEMAKTILLAAILAFFAYGCEHLVEAVFIVDYRFIFPFASDLTAYRAGMCLRYFPFVLTGFIFLGVFIHGQMRRPLKRTWLGTFINWSTYNILLLTVPIVIFLMIQYIPLFIAGTIPFVGPGGMFVSFVLGLFHILGVLIMVIPISTWFYQLTGKIYLGAFVNAAIVTWMFMSSQVIAPIPV
ncbi:alpha/beta hydrolase [Thermodesulfobacteriota bacterium]